MVLIEEAGKIQEFVGKITMNPYMVARGRAKRVSGDFLPDIGWY